MAPMPDRLGFDPYDILGVGRDATPLQVARAHRRLAKRHHPDLHPSDAAATQMRRINEAWDVLSSPGRRAEFDRRNPVAGLPKAAHWSPSRADVDLGRRAGGAPSWDARAAGPGTYRSVRHAAAHSARPARAYTGSAGSGYRRTATAVDVATPPTFRDSPWAAIVVALVLVGFVLLAAGIGSQYWAAQQGERQLIDADGAR